MNIPTPPSDRRSPLRQAASRLKSMAIRMQSRALNNVVVNNAAILLGLESKIRVSHHPYQKWTNAGETSLQRLAGFADRPEINQTIAATHAHLARVASERIPAQGSAKRRVLDFGCGPGLYLKDFSPDQWDATGIDMNDTICAVARQTCPSGEILHGNFLSLNLPVPYDLIYSVSVLEYIARTSLDDLFQKTSRSLNPGGVLFLNYPHAVSRWDLWYPDLSYIQYSPRLIQKVASRYLEIVEHRHAFDDRVIDKYDQSPYPSLNPNTQKSFRNSTVLIARRPA